MTQISTLGQALDQIERIKQQQELLGTLQYQVSSGKKAQSFIELGADSLISERSRAEFNQLDIYLNNIVRGETRINQMLNALTQISTQAQNTLNGLAGQPQQGNIDMTIIKSVAENAFEFVINLLNLQDGDTYLFGGSDSSTQPIRDTGALDSFIRDLNNLWTTGDPLLSFTPPDTITDAYISAFQSIADTTAGFSGSLQNAGKVFVTADNGVELDYTVLANDPALRDIVIALGVIKNLPDVLDAPPPQGQVVSQVDLETLSAGVSLDAAPGNPFAPSADAFEITFDPDGPLDTGPISIDLSDVQLANPAPPAASGAQALVDYLNGTIIPSLQPPLSTTTRAFINGSGQVVINAETSIEIDRGTMGVAGLSFLGLSEGVTEVTDNDSKDAFFQVFNELAVMLTHAIDKIDQIEYRLNNVQVFMAQAEETHKFDKNTLLSTIADVEDVDLSEVATQLNFLQIQLEASFRVTAAVSNLSLINFL